MERFFLILFIVNDKILYCRAQCYRLTNIGKFRTFTSFWKTNRSHLSLESNRVLQFDERDVIVIIIRRITAMLNHFIDTKFLRLCLCGGVTIVFQYPHRYELGIEPVVGIGIRYPRLKIIVLMSKAQNYYYYYYYYRHKISKSLKSIFVINVSKISKYCH